MAKKDDRYSRWGERARPSRHRRFAPRGRHDPEEVDNVVGRLFDRRTREKLSNSLLLSQWEDIVGKTIAQNATPLHIEAGVLLLKVSHPVWRSELMSLRSVMISKINEAAGRTAVRQIQFR